MTYSFDDTKTEDSDGRELLLTSLLQAPSAKKFSSSSTLSRNDDNNNLNECDSNSGWLKSQIKSTFIHPAPIVRPHVKAVSEESRSRTRRLVSLLQSHLTAKRETIQSSSLDSSSKDNDPAQTTAQNEAAQRRRLLEERLRAKLEAEKALLQAELEREQQERLAKKVANEAAALGILEAAKELRTADMAVHRRTQTQPALYWSPAPDHQ